MGSNPHIYLSIANGILQNLPAIIESMGSILSQMIAFIMQNLPTILQAGVTLIKNLAQGLVQNLPTIISSIAKVIAQLLAAIAKYLPQLLQSGIKLLGELAAGLIQAIPQLVSKIPTIISNIVSAFSQFDWLSIGTNIISGIADGIKAGISAIVEAAKNAAKSALDAAKNFLGINSPSRVMKQEVGRWIPAGVAEGITSNTKTVAMAMKDLAKETAGTLQADLAMGVSQGQKKLDRAQQQGLYAQGGGYTQIVNVYSPTELSPSEVARRTRNATRNMVLSLKGV